MLLICWFYSLALSVTPIILKKELMQKLVISNIKNTWTASHLNSIPPSKVFITLDTIKTGTSTQMSIKNSIQIPVSM